MLALLLVMSLLLGPRCFAEQGPERVGALSEAVSFDFGETDIRSFIETISQLTGRNFVIDSRVAGKITVLSPKKIPPDEIFEFFETILNVYGFSVVPSGSVYKVLPVRNLKSENIPLGRGALIPDGGSNDRVVTQLYFLEHISSAELLTALRPLLTETGAIVDHRETNSLIITDTGTNVRRIVRILQSLDTPQAVEVFTTRRLQHASASKVAQILLDLFGKTPSRAANAKPEDSAFKAIPDERTNMLLLVVPPNLREKVEATLDELDTPVESRKSTIHLYFLENADATELAKVLSDSRILEDSLNTQKQTTASQPQARAGQNWNVVPGATQDLLTGIKITADPSTNSLIVRCEPEQFAELSTIIKMLDGPRMQVLVEALIAEITDDGLRDIGVEWAVAQAGDTSVEQGFGAATFPLGGEGSNLTGFITNPANPPAGLLLGVASGTVTYQGKDYFNVSTLARAFETDQKINVLSTPHLLTSDHSEAELIVGERRPFLRSSQVTAEGGTVRSFDYEDVGIKMKIRPHITQNRRIRLKLFQEVTDFVEQQEVGAVTTTKRSVDTTVVVDDAQTLIIGGLMREQDSLGESKIPCLGDIPGLGLLFKRARKRNAKTNLLVFITPRVIVTRDEATRATQQRQQQLPSGKIDAGIIDWNPFEPREADAAPPAEPTAPPTDTSATPTPTPQP